MKAEDEPPSIDAYIDAVTGPIRDAFGPDRLPIRPSPRPSPTCRLSATTSRPVRSWPGITQVMVSAPS